MKDQGENKKNNMFMTTIDNHWIRGSADTFLRQQWIGEGAVIYPPPPNTPEQESIPVGCITPLASHQMSAPGGVLMWVGLGIEGPVR